MTDAVQALAWTCARCKVTASWMPEVEHPALPAGWAQREGVFHCLSCRRELAGEAGVLGIAEDVSTERRQQIRSHARIEFEVARAPDRADNRIAKSCRTSVVAVRRARERLGIPRVPPPAS